MKKFYNKKEVAEVFQVAPITIERWLRAGKLRGAKIGKEWRISEEDIAQCYEDIKAAQQIEK